jgi:hypothetical protein
MATPRAEIFRRLVGTATLPISLHRTSVVRQVIVGQSRHRLIPGQPFETLGHVHGIADHRVFQKLIVAERARKDFPVMRADADLHRREPGSLTFIRPLLDRIQNLESAGDRARGIIRTWERHAEHDQGSVTDELVDAALVLEHRCGEPASELRKEGAPLVRLHRLGHGGEAADVDEQDGGRVAGATKQVLVRVRRQSLGDLGRKETGEPRGPRRLLDRLDQEPAGAR